MQAQEKMDYDQTNEVEVRAFSKVDLVPLLEKLEPEDVGPLVAQAMRIALSKLKNPYSIDKHELYFRWKAKQGELLEKFAPRADEGGVGTEPVINPPVDPPFRATSTELYVEQRYGLGLNFFEAGHASKTPFRTEHCKDGDYHIVSNLLLDDGIPPNLIESLVEGDSAPMQEYLQSVEKGLTKPERDAIKSAKLPSPESRRPMYFLLSRANDAFKMLAKAPDADLKNPPWVLFTADQYYALFPDYDDEGVPRPVTPSRRRDFYNLVNQLPGVAFVSKINGRIVKHHLGSYKPPSTTADAEFQLDPTIWEQCVKRAVKSLPVQPMQKLTSKNTYETALIGYLAMKFGPNGFTAWLPVSAVTTAIGIERANPKKVTEVFKRTTDKLVECGYLQPAIYEGRGIARRVMFSAHASWWKEWKRKATKTD